MIQRFDREKIKKRSKIDQINFRVLDNFDEDSEDYPYPQSVFDKNRSLKIYKQSLGEKDPLKLDYFLNKLLDVAGPDYLYLFALTHVNVLTNSQIQTLHHAVIDSNCDRNPYIKKYYEDIILRRRAMEEMKKQEIEERKKRYIEEYNKLIEEQEKENQR